MRTRLRILTVISAWVRHPRNHNERSDIMAVPSSRGFARKWVTYSWRQTNEQAFWANPVGRHKVWTHMWLPNRESSVFFRSTVTHALVVPTHRHQLRCVGAWRSLDAPTASRCPTETSFGVEENLAPRITVSVARVPGGERLGFLPHSHLTSSHYRRLCRPVAGRGFRRNIDRLTAANTMRGPLVT